MNLALVLLAAAVLAQAPATPSAGAANTEPAKSAATPPAATATTPAATATTPATTATTPAATATTPAATATTPAAPATAETPAAATTPAAAAVPAAATTASATATTPGDPASAPSPASATATEPSSPAARADPAPALPAVEQGALSTTAGPFNVKLSAALRLAQTVGSPIQLDDQGTTTSPTPFELRLRLGPEVRLGNWGLISEFDVATGAVFGTPSDTVVASRVPTPNFKVAELRQLYLQYRWATGAVRVGAQTSNFGLGMLANSGARDPEPGDFGIQHGGAVVLRAAVAGRPLFGLGGALRAVEPVAAFDLVLKDPTADLLAGDRALQGILGLRFNVDDDHQVALTGIYRNQRRDNGAPGERSTDAFVLDLFARWTVLKTADSALTLAGELVGITGTTTQSRSDTAEVLDLRQLGAVAKVHYRAGRLGLLLDGGFASGDQNPYDAQLSNFRFDPNYKVGLIVFDQVLGYQSARSGLRAADPLLAGVPPEGIDLLPSAGSITGAWFLFPKAKYAFAEWMDLYGGPLFAFTTAQLTDPFNTRLNGGTPLNYLGARPGNYLGTELDLGLSVRARPTSSLQLSATLEGGVLLPGDAFRTAAGSTLGPIGVGRLRLTASL